jgi:hypothetical protein
MQAGQSHFPMSFFPHRRHFLSFRLMMIGPGFGAYLSLMAFSPFVERWCSNAMAHIFSKIDAIAGRMGGLIKKKAGSFSWCNKQAIDLAWMIHYYDSRRDEFKIRLCAKSTRSINFQGRSVSGKRRGEGIVIFPNPGAGQKSPS